VTNEEYIARLRELSDEAYNSYLEMRDKRTNIAPYFQGESTGLDRARIIFESMMNEREVS